jgi:hypothetical protein
MEGHDHREVRVSGDAMTLPLWLQILQAFVQILQALAVFAVSAVGACLAWQQVRIADAKLQHDLFDKRFQVFEATRRLLEIAITEKALSQEEERLFTLETGDALFLFDDDIAKYLREEMIGHVDGLIAARSALKTALTEEQRTKFTNEQFEHLTWLGEQITGHVDKFRPFLTLDKRQPEAKCWQAVVAWLRRHVLRRPGS